MRKPSKEQIKNLLLLVAVICLFKIAFFGIETNIKTSRIDGIPVDVSGDVTIDTVFPIRVDIEN